TNYRLGRLPLVIGMPVIIGYNYDVQAGIVNGTTGFLQKIRYTHDPHTGIRHLLSCVVKCNKLNNFIDLPNLEHNEVAVLEDTISM
ncbi:hypothetical protein EV361DRAFT_767667, partial [Lentinula raphanica]